MSWRFIFAVLIIIAGASAWGGLRLGDWLVAHGPPVVELPNHSQAATVPVLNADGRPFIAQPPQPLVDGRLAVPEPPPETHWEIPAQSIAETTFNPLVDLATTPITMDEAQQIAASGGQKLQGIADVGNLGLGTSATRVQNQPIQPIELPAMPTTPSPSANAGAWQAHLRQDLQTCSAQGFFDRPSCAWAARNKYCAANNAWGKVDDCPAKRF